MDSISNQSTSNERRLEEAKNEVLRKVGINVLLFQQMELALKALVSTSNISGYASEIEAKRTAKIESVKTQTMGQLVGQYIENYSPDQDNKSDEPENLTESYISISCFIKTDEETHNKKKELMASLVEERNNLVHHFLPTFDSSSISSCIGAQGKLDKQADKVRREVESFKATLMAQNTGRELLASFAQTKEFKKYLEISFSQQSLLANILTDFTKTIVRDDGWVVLNKAVSTINQNHPSELKKLKKNHGCKKLKDMMIKTELFEFSEEETTKGGNRVLYRLRLS